MGSKETLYCNVGVNLILTTNNCVGTKGSFMDEFCLIGSENFDFDIST